MTYTQKLHALIDAAIASGATTYVCTPTERSLLRQDGSTAMRLPVGTPQADEVLRFALQQLAWKEYRQLEGKVVHVRCISGYDASSSVDVAFEDRPLRVRVLSGARSGDICHWAGGYMEEEHLDPTWAVEVVDRNVPELKGLDSFWIHATNRSISGKVDASDVVRPESFPEKMVRLLTPNLRWHAPAAA